MSKGLVARLRLWYDYRVVCIQILGRIIMKKRPVLILMIFTLLFSFAPYTAASEEITADQAADELFSLGLFRGTSDGGYELDRSMTRQEAVVMLIRLLGKEQTAVGNDWPHMFSDVSLWADNYVGYACAKELTTGYSETVFGSADNVTAAQYITLVLRALGYRDGAGDFSWKTPWLLSDSIGLTHGEYGDGGDFTRADAVLISYNALDMRLKGGDLTLLEFLSLSASEPVPLSEGPGLTAAEISQKCSDAVFYLATYSDEGYSTASMSGSGFFISDSGVAATSYHVIENARSARVTLTTGEQFNVTHVIYADRVNDFAVLKVEGVTTNGKAKGSFPYLEMGDSSEVKNGDVIYTIGSPLGMQNSISDGIVGNSSRTRNGVEQIQITAAVSFGSSGSALINESGKVIGIIRSAFEDSQSISGAVPINLVKSVDITAAGTEFSKYPDTPEADTVAKYSLTASQTSVILQKNQTERLTVKHNYPGQARIGWTNSDRSVTGVEWGNWIDSYNVELYLSGLKSGTSTIRIFFLDEIDGEVSAAEIVVRVAE